MKNKHQEKGNTSNFEQIISGLKKTKNTYTQSHKQFKFSSHRKGRQKEPSYLSISAGSRTTAEFWVYRGTSGHAFTCCKCQVLSVSKASFFKRIPRVLQQPAVIYITVTLKVSTDCFLSKKKKRHRGGEATFVF